jgi:hypothetical protein
MHNKQGSLSFRTRGRGARPPTGARPSAPQLVV